MILGTGIDIVKVERIQQSVERNGERFLHRVFTPIEIEHCMKRKDPYPSLAVRFAAKEACIKALKVDQFVSKADIGVINAPDGKPSITVEGPLEKAFEKMGVKRAHLSLTHEKEYAVAMVILEG